MEDLSEAVNTTEDWETACAKEDEAIDNFFQIFFAAAVIFIFGLSFIVRRKNRLLECCWGRPGILQPLNFIDDSGRRWAYAACFVVLTNSVLKLFIGESYWNFMPKDDAAWMKKYGWVKVFDKLWEVFSVCLVYYPLLACVYHRRSIAANVVGILYLIPWIVVYSIFFQVCSILDEKGALDLIIQIFSIPIYIALYVVGISYILDLVLNIRRLIARRRSRTNEVGVSDSIEVERDYKISHHMQYVTNLLRRKRFTKNEEPVNFIKKKLGMAVEKVKYDKVPGFRYSTRLICSLTVAFTFLFWVIVLFVWATEFLFKAISTRCLAEKDIYSASPVFGLLLIWFCDTCHIFRILLHVSFAISALVIVCLLINSLITYKQRWHQLLRGDHSWHVFGPRVQVPQNILLNGLKYAGYQVAYAIWGLAVLFFFLFLLFTFIAYQLILPLMEGRTSLFIEFIKDHWVGLFLVIVVLPIIQKLLCRFVFLQGRGSKLALDNRRLYNAASYYFLILNVAVGIFSCLKRILIPLVLGIAFLSRLDQPLIMKGYEQKDPGYCAFVSMLLVDLYHNHPVLKTFVELLLQANQRKKTSSGRIFGEILTDKGDKIIESSGMKDLEQVQSEEKMRRSKQIRNRWLKTLTLINNPSLTLTVLERRLKEELKIRVEQNSTVTLHNGSHCAIEMVPLTDAEDSKRTSMVLLGEESCDGK